MSDTSKSKRHGDADKLKHVKKRRPQDDKRQSATVRELLKQKRTDFDMNIPSDLKSPEPVDKGSIICFINIFKSVYFVFSEEPKKPLSSVTLASINDTIESVVKATTDVNNAHEVQNNSEISRNIG